MLRLTIIALISTISTSALAWEPSDDPVDVPRACVDPVGLDGVTSLVTRGPKLVGVYRLKDRKTLDTPKLRLRAYGEFIPERLGSSRGEVQARFEAALLPDVVRDGPNPENSVFTSAPGVLRIGLYRVSLRTVTTKPLTYDATVEEIGCPEEGTTPPLATAHDTRTFWVSTDGVMKYGFSRRPWYMSGDRLQITLLTSLDPDVQQKDKANPTGGIMLHMWEGLDGHPRWGELTDGKIAGSVTQLQDHKIEVLRVIWGKDTRLVDDRLVTKGTEPAATILVRVTRTQVTPRGY